MGDIVWDDPFKLASPVPQGNGGSGIVWDDEEQKRVVQTQKKRTPTEEFKRQLGLTARIPLEALTGSMNAIGAGVAGGANLIGEAGSRLGLPKPNPVPIPSVPDQLTNAGMPAPENTLEKIVNFGGNVMGGAFDPMMRGIQQAVNKLAPALRPPVTMPPDERTQLAKEAFRLHERGIKLPPSMMQGKVGSNILEGAAGEANVLRDMTVRNMPTQNNMTARALKEWPELDIDGKKVPAPLTFESLKANVDKWVARGYDPIRSLPEGPVYRRNPGNLPATPAQVPGSVPQQFRGIGIGKQYRDDLANIVRDYSGGDSFPGAAKDAVKAEVNKYLLDPRTGRYLQSYSGEDAIKAVRNLRNDADANMMTRDPDKMVLGKVQTRIAKALEDNIELNLKSMPGVSKELVQNFRTARTEIAKSFSIKEALTDPKTGTVNTGSFHEQAMRGQPLSDGLDLLSTAGSPMFAHATHPPFTGQPLPFSAGMSPFTGGAAAAGVMTGHPHLALAQGGIPLVKGAARRIIGSDAFQNRLARNVAPPSPSALDLYGESDAFRRSLPLMPLGLLPLFSQGQQ